MKKLTALGFLLLAFPPASLGFDIPAYLDSLNKYYFNLSTAGAKSFQAKARVSFSGQLPKGILKAWRGLDWQNDHSEFDFTYVGGNVLPIMAFSSNGGDPEATPARMRLVGNMVNSMLEIWGAFVATPLYSPRAKGHRFEIARSAVGAFAVVEKVPGLTVAVDFDRQSLAKKMRVETKADTKDIDLEFFPTPRGSLPRRIGMRIRTQPSNTLVAMDMVIQYRENQGILLPSNITLYMRSPGQIFQAAFDLSGYAVQKAGDLAQSADGGDTQVVPASMEAPGARHFFWRVTSPTATVYLLGSIHIRPKTPLQVPEVVERGLEASQYVGFEYDLSKQGEVEREYPGYVREHFSYPPGDELPNHLTLGQWKLLQLIAGKEGVPVDDLRPLKPFIVTDYIARMGKSAGGMGLKKHGVDYIFLRKAQAANKPVFGMEFWYAPFQLEDGMREPEQVYYLFGSSGASQNQVRLFDKMLADWQTGNVVDLESLTYSGLSPDDKAIMEKIILQRNQDWVPQMDRILKTNGTYFIVVGSAHLVGNFGLPALLQQRGYTVDQL